MGIIAERWLVNESVHLTVHRASGLRRLTGLIGRRELPHAAALSLPRCRSVHGFGMTRPVDVVFLGVDNQVTSTRRLAPWRCIGDRAARSALELRAGEARRLGVVVGSQLRQSIEGEL
jgi:uncharacterized membrane protein (UPF0127 family)